MDKPAWTTTHPTEPGLVWVSVEPAGRNPAPWVVLEPVFPIRINDEGEVWEDGKDEPTYNVSAIPKMGRAVKYMTGVEEMPEDPWTP